MTTTIAVDLAATNAAQANTPIPILVVAAVNPDGTPIAGGAAGNNVNINQVGGTAITLGQKASAASLPAALSTENMAAMTAFAFVANSTLTIAATTTSANTALGAAATGVLQIANTGTTVAFVALGTVAQTASTTSYPILPGAAVVISGQGATNIAAMTASGTATLYVSRGTGL